MDNHNSLQTASSEETLQQKLRKYRQAKGIDPLSDSPSLSPNVRGHGSRASFLEGHKPFRGRIVGRTLLDLHPPLIDYRTNPSDRYMIPSSTKGIVIDFDGTIMKIRYTEGRRQAAYKAAIKEAVLLESGRELTNAEIDRCHRAGVNNPERKMAELIANELAQNHGYLIDHAKIFACWLKHWENQLNSELARHSRPIRSALVPGIEPLIIKANRLGIPVTVCTAGHDLFVEPLLHHTGVMSNLRLDANVFINRHPDIKSKPSGDPYLLAANLLGITPDSMIVLEDSATGALAALRAGARVLLQPSGDLQQTIGTLVYHVKTHHPEWLVERPRAVIVLAPGLGWRQVEFEERDRSLF